MADPVLAIGLDAVESSLLLRLLDRLPVLRDLFARGSWHMVRSSAHLGSASVWPTMATRQPAERHGLYAERNWDPARMSLTMPEFAHVTPFWRELGAGVTTLDVPFVPARGPGLEVSQWGAHDWMGDRLECSRPEVLPELSAPHPFRMENCEDPARLESGCREGIRRRGELLRRLWQLGQPRLLVGVFTELHRAQHFLWHDPERLSDLFQAVDAEIGRLLELAGSRSRVLIFSLHGMRRNHGTPDLLRPWLVHQGLTVERQRRLTPGDVARAVKARVPEPAKRLYHMLLPRRVRYAVAQHPMRLPDCRWEATSVFSLPTDQHGFLRLNLRGRESRGAVPPERYAELVENLAERLLRLRTAAGKPVAQRVIRVAEELGEVPRRLPDLVVHWNPEMEDPEIELAEPRLRVGRIGRHFSGEHAMDGFLLAVRPSQTPPPVVESTELAHWMRPDA